MVKSVAKNFYKYDMSPFYVTNIGVDLSVICDWSRPLFQ